MKEDLLQYIWQHKVVLNQALHATNGDALEVIQIGQLNHHAGPDFFNAKIRINNTLLVGNIEIHTKASHWISHKHTANNQYDNVILHVVYDNDTPIYDKQNQPLLTLELKNYLNPSFLEKYSIIQKQKSSIPCEPIFILPTEFKLNSWLNRLMVERLEKKCETIELLLQGNQNNWEQTFYLLTARYFGQKVNEQAFEWVAQNLPLNVIAKHKDKLSQIEALIFGTAGFLDKELKDDYLKFLQSEYRHLKKKYNLVSIDSTIWKFGKTRPSNFPSIRLMQFATFIYQSNHLFSKILKAESIKELIALYELKHLHIIHLAELSGHDFSKLKGDLGKSTINTLLINTVVPLVFLYGKLRFDEDKSQKALNWLEELQAEKNSVVLFWQNLGVKTNNALQTQALLQLKNEYCDHKKCLQCAIGHGILNNPTIL
jgi:hypothetical protein